MAEAALSGAPHPLLDNDYASEWMGIEVLGLSDGHATIRMTLRQEMLNGFGNTAFALACNPIQPAPGEENNITVASGVDINFLKPAFRGQVLTAVADRRSSAGRSGLYDIQIFAADAGAPAPEGQPSSSSPGELIAEFRGRSRTIPKK